MKKNHNLQGGACILLLASLFLFPTCALHKERSQKEQLYQKSFTLQTDTLYLTRQINQKQQFVVDREEIHFSVPDSSGRQHITTLIRNRVGEQNESSVHDTLSVHSDQQSLHMSHFEKQFKQSPASPIHLPYWMWVVIVLLSLLFFGKAKNRI